MNKELREDLEHLIICNDKTITQDLRDDIKMTLDYIDNLEKKINKAIKYINNHSLNFNNEIETDLQVEEVKELEKMLKGE